MLILKTGHFQQQIKKDLPCTTVLNIFSEYASTGKVVAIIMHTFQQNSVDKK